MYTDHTTQRKSQKETMTRHHNANVREIEKIKSPFVSIIMQKETIDVEDWGYADPRQA